MGGNDGTSGQDDDLLTEEQSDAQFDEAFKEAAKQEPQDLSASDNPDNFVEEEAAPAPGDAGTAGTDGAEFVEERGDDAARALDLDAAGTAGTPGSERQPGESAEDYKQRWLSLQGIYKSEKAAWETERTQLLAKAEGTLGTAGTAGTSQTAEEKDAAAQAFLDSLTDEQREALKAYDEEFDTVAKMEGLKRDSALAKLRKELTGYIDELKSQLAPATELVAQTKASKEEQEVAAHFQAIADSHPDYERYRDDGSILKWIKSKPGYLQPGMLATYNEGTAEDTIDLIGDFKKENNIQPVPRPNGSRSSARREMRKDAMRAPASRRSAINTQMHPADDYDSAFDEAARA